MFKHQMGILPNFPITHSIQAMHQQISELHGELIGAGCSVEQNFDEFIIKVPAGSEAQIEAIMQRHVGVFKQPTVGGSACSRTGGEDAHETI